MKNYLYKDDDILKEVNYVLNMDNNFDSDCISIYDIALFYKNVSSRYDIMRKKNYDKLENACNLRFDDIYKLRKLDFDYKKSELIIEFDIFGEMVLKMINNNLCVVKENFLINNFFPNMFDVLMDVYNDFMKYEDFIKKDCFDVKVENSKFFVSISSFRVKMYMTTNPLLLCDSFSLSSLNSSNNYMYDCNSSSIISFIIGKEDEIFKHSYIKIDQCPKWIQDDMFKIKEEKLRIRNNKFRMKEKIKKIFPFYGK